MIKKPSNDPVLQEIFSHIEQLHILKTETKPNIEVINHSVATNTDHPIVVNTEKQKTVTPNEQVKEIPLPYQSIHQPHHEITKMIRSPIERLNDNSFRTCDLCHHEIILGKNLAGLVMENKYFACETCCQTTSKEELKQWIQSKMLSTNTLRPIGLWLTQEKNKKTTMLLRK